MLSFSYCYFNDLNNNIFVRFNGHFYDQFWTIFVTNISNQIITKQHFKIRCKTYIQRQSHLSNYAYIILKLKFIRLILVYLCWVLKF